MWSMVIYSKDLRVRAVAVVERGIRGIARREIVETFSISHYDAKTLA